MPPAADWPYGAIFYRLLVAIVFRKDLASFAPLAVDFCTMIPATMEISEESRKEAIASLQQYFRENLPEEIGSIAAGGR